MMSIDLDDSFVSHFTHPNTPNPYNIPSSTSISTSTELESNQPRVCSVRGCSLPLAPGTINKMCEACRGRHRVYATTKRARRKMEKAAILGMGRVDGELTDENSRVWMSTSVPSAVAPKKWNEGAIDPQLYTEPSSSDTTHISVYQNISYSKGSNSSSELAGALTLPTSTVASSSGTPLVAHPLRHTSKDTVGHDNGNGQYYGNHANESESDDEEHEVSTTLQPVGQGDSSGTVANADQISSDTDSSRFCSVKGCKLIIPSNYTFKMCPSCRIRYRTYGNTKRAKWKAEREAFDRELSGLRIVEDERRRQTGERSLSESPEDLRAWELSIIDEQIVSPFSVAPTLALDGTAGQLRPGETQNLNEDGAVTTNLNLYSNGGGVNPTAIQTSILPPSTTLPQSINTDIQQSISTSSQFQSSISMSPLPPARMCTVSHCHKLLPGFYRYKRCEQHRLQNRYHSQLKRVREKVEKAFGPDGEELEVMMGEGENEKSEKENKTRTISKKAKLEGPDGSGDPNRNISSGDKPRKRNLTCLSDECHNLLGPATRWRHCDICRARERVLKRERKELEGEEKEKKGENDARKEIGRLQEIVRRMAAGEKVGEANMSSEARAGEIEQYQRYPEGHDKGLNAPAESESASNITPNAGVSKEVPTTTADSLTTPSVVPTNSVNTLNSAKESPATFQNVFRATPVPFVFTSISNANTTSNQTTSLLNTTSSSVVDLHAGENALGDSNPSDISTTNGQPVTFTTADTPLTFRAHQPQTASSATGRLVTHNPEVSVQVFKNLLLPRKERQVNTGLVGESSFHVYKSLPPPIGTPAASAPSIQENQQSHTTNGVTEGTKIDEARTTQESNSGNGASDSRMNVGFTPSSSTTLVASGPNSTSSTPQHSATPAIISETSSTSANPRKRSRATPKPNPLPQPLPPPSMPSHYPYASHPQYPYPYYMAAPYNMLPYASQVSPLPSANHQSPLSILPSSSTHSPYPPPPGTYPYTYPLYGYPPTHSLLPGYPYLPPRYVPSAYGSPPPAPGQPYVTQQSPLGSYPSTYGYTKDTRFSHYRRPPETPAVAASRPKKKQKRGKEDASHTTQVSPPPVTIPPVAAEQPVPRQPSPMTPIVNNVATVNHTAQQENEAPITSNTQQTEVISSTAVQIRPCGNKTCNKTIPINTTNAICEKCRSRLKKRQMKAKQRFKLEPRKPILNMKEGKKEDNANATNLATSEAAT